MAPPTWATDEQTAFLLGEDATWILIKASGRTLKSFYTQTTTTFLQMWPRTPTEKTLTLAKGDEAKAKAMVVDQTWKQIASWYGNLHRGKKSLPPAPKPLLDLAGKNARKKPPLQRWQAFSAVYYRPPNSPLRPMVRSLFERRGDPTAVAFLAKFIPSGADITTMDYLNFLGVFLRERCSHLSSEEEEQVEAHIEQQQLLATEHRDQPWALEEDYKNNPVLVENRYIQGLIDELPRVAQRALDEIERTTGFKAILVVGGLTPIDGGAISTNLHTTGYSTTTGLTFSESWDGCADMRAAFGEWLKMAYTEDEKRHREGFSASSLKRTPDATADDMTPGGMGPDDVTTDDMGPDDATTDDAEPDDATTNDTGLDDEDLFDKDLYNEDLDDAGPNDMTSDNATLDNTTLDDAAPNDAIPHKTTANTDPDAITPDGLTLIPGGLAPATSNEDPATNAPPVSPRTSEPPSSRRTSATVTPVPEVAPSPVGRKSPPTITTTPARPFKHDQLYPGFITPDVIEHLNLVDGGSRWVEMVNSYLTLESQYHSRRPGRLSLKHRPEEVAVWTRQRNLTPTITNLQKFREDWITWWGSCQPKWRSTKTWPYPCDDARDRDWDRLNVTGASGLFAVVMSTSWWAASTDSDSHREVFDTAIEDLRWVIDNLIHFNSKLPVSGLKQVDAAPAEQFPGHGTRGPGKRTIKPTPKVINRT